jgi:hypothetical protein
MSAGTDISALYCEFTDALTEVLAETAGTPVRRGRLARARAAVKRHPNYSEHEYFLAVETAFTHWEAMQNVGRQRSATAARQAISATAPACVPSLRAAASPPQ